MKVFPLSKHILKNAGATVQTELDKVCRDFLFNVTGRITLNTFIIFLNIKLYCEFFICKKLKTFLF